MTTVPDIQGETSPPRADMIMYAYSHPGPLTWVGVRRPDSVDRRRDGLGDIGGRGPRSREDGSP